MKALSIFSITVASLFFVGCQTAPSSDEGKVSLKDESQSALDMFVRTDPGLKNFLDTSYAYVIFPSVGKGGLIAGGAYGHGTVYEQGVLVGYADISQATVGAQIGGQKFAEIIALENKAAFDRFTSGKLTFAANASAVILKSGAATAAKYTDGVAIFVKPEAGAMAEASIGGQSFSYQPK